VFGFPFVQRKWKLCCAIQILYIKRALDVTLLYFFLGGVSRVLDI